MAERSATVVENSYDKWNNGYKINDDADTAILIVEEFEHNPVRISASDVEDAILKYDDNDDNESLEEELL